MNTPSGAVVKGNVISGNKFPDDIILKEFGEIPISSTQKLKVSLVYDGYLGQPRIAAQKWYREDRTLPWKIGKGFKLTGRQAVEMGNMLSELGKEMIHVK